MKRMRTVALGAAAATLAIGTVAVPVVAADPLLAIVNGIPGRSVDVCIGNREVRSGLRYGGWVQRSVAPGDSTVRFRVASPGRCQGTVLARRTLSGLLADADLTVVGTARTPLKVVVFDNTPVPIGLSDSWKAIRHAADVGPVVVTEDEIEYEDPSPAALPPEWVKGDEEIDVEPSVSEMIAVAKPNKARPFLGPTQFNMRDGRRTELIIVGTRPRNARFVVIDRPSLPL